MTRKFYEVSGRGLLLIAAIVWMIAGFNVARLGVISYGRISFHWYYPALTVLTFVLFGRMFYKMSGKHGRRIRGYAEPYRPFWNFFDARAYIIMAIMMGGGIWCRNTGIFPDIFVAFFYTGLGCALFLAGVLFVYMYATYNK